MQLKENVVRIDNIEHPWDKNRDFDITTFDDPFMRSTQTRFEKGMFLHYFVHDTFIELTSLIH